MSAPISSDLPPIARRRPVSEDRRSLWPKEHGAYAQVGLPLAVALACGRASAGSAALGAAALCAFLAHEPIRVALGHRGSRAMREDGARARRRGGALTGTAAALGALGLCLAPGAGWAATAALPMALLAAAFAARNVDRSLPGELIAAVALPGLALPVAVASSVAPLAALSAWAAWAHCFAASTAAVRSLTAKDVGERRGMPWLLASLCAAWLGWIALGRWGAIAAAPTLAVAVAVAVVRPAMKSIRRVGWSFAAASVVTAVVLVVRARAS